MSPLLAAPNKYARFAGIVYLLIIALGIFGQVIVRNDMVDFNNGALTSTNIVEGEFFWRLGIAGDIFMQVLDIPLMILLYFLLRPVNKLIAVIAVSFNIIQTAVLVANKLVMLTPLLVLNSSLFASAFSEQQIHTVVLTLADLHDYGFGIGLIFFGFATICYGVLIYQSNYLPRFIGIFMALAGTSYLINSLTLLVFPSLSGVVFPILVISLVGELSFALWLVLKGVKVSIWHQIHQTKVN